MNVCPFAKGFLAADAKSVLRERIECQAHSLEMSEADSRNTAPHESFRRVAVDQEHQTNDCYSQNRSLE
jgi:hypothetical protein